MKIKGNKLVVLASTLIIMMGCENDLTEVREMAGKNTNTEVGTQIDSYLSLEGKMKAHLTAPTIIRYVAEGPKRSEFPNSLHVDFFNDSNKIESRIDAQYGNYNENEKKVLLKKNVVATNIYGDTLQTDELWWDQNAEKFYTDKKVIFSKNYRNDYFIGLKGMTCNENLTDLRLFEIEDKSFFIYKDSSAQSTPAPPPVLQQRKK
jgi:LPS export ABC transporter protein LptC